jgi:hypothetical protein
MEEKNILDVSVILPLSSSLVKSFEDLLDKSIKSLENQVVGINELVIVHSKEESLKNLLSKMNFGKLNVKMVENDGPTDFASQVNLGVKEATSKWVSILEFDDEFSKIWFKNVKKYTEIYTDVDAFMPIVVDIDNKSVFAGFTNEATFAANFSQEMGTLTNETLLSYQNFQYI